MSNFSEESANILIKWLRKAEIEVVEQNMPGFEERRLAIGSAIGAIYQLKKKDITENIPHSPHHQIDRQWTDVILNELFSFNSNGAEYICSISEATIKVHGLKNLLAHTSNDPMFFRGEHIFGWELISRLGRKHPLAWSNVNSKEVTPLELKFLKEFQLRVKSDKELETKIFGNSSTAESGNVVWRYIKNLINKIFGNSHVLADNDVGWWSIMQHYDEDRGTRMIDITSSLYSALYFACADFIDGRVDDANDGKLYMFPHPPGRTETNTPDMFKEQVVGSEDQIEITMETYFNVKSSFDVPRFRISPVMNNRALSQDGYFIWQRHFDKPFNFDKLGGQIFPFRVHRDYKKSIIKELEAIGYTRNRILADNRFDRESV